MKTLLASVLLLPIAFSAAQGAEKKAQPDRAKMEEMTRLQVFLDRANFGPGKIDGRGGEFTKKALERFRSTQAAASQQTGTAPAPAGGNAATAPGAEALPPAQNSAAPAASEEPRDEGSSEERKAKKAKSRSKGEEEQLDTAGLDLQSVGDPFTTYTVAAADVENIGDVPKEPEAQAKLKSMPYRTPGEAIAEKFHADIDFIKELNPKVDLESLKEGDQLIVPNVEPFEVAAVKEIKPGEALAAAAGTPAESSEKEEQAKEKASKKREKRDSDKDSDEEEKEPASKVTVRVDTKNKMLDVLEGERLIAAFPVTPGSDSIPTPTGEWKVKGVAKMPDFRYDKKLLKEGERSDDAHLIPPGPNNPVGVVWIALNKPGIGLHGTDEPDTIGRAASHGCVRLANWDVVKLARLIKGGVNVTIE